MTWVGRQRDADFEWRALRAQAEEVQCPQCGAQPGEHCHNRITGDEMRAPAHAPRIQFAAKREAS